MAFNRNIPPANQLLSDSQSLILDNFNSSDDSFNTDHYGFSNTTANNGFHNKVTMPIIAPVPPNPNSAHPSSATNTIAYAMQDCPGIGTIQYSRGPTFNGYTPAPTPITRLYSSVSPIAMSGPATTNVLDCTGLTALMARLYVTNYGSTVQFLMTSDVLYFLNGATPVFKFITNYVGSSSSSIVPFSSGKILQISALAGATYNNIFWSLELVRINI